MSMDPLIAKLIEAEQRALEADHVHEWHLSMVTIKDGPSAEFDVCAVCGSLAIPGTGLVVVQRVPSPKITPPAAPKGTE